MPLPLPISPKDLIEQIIDPALDLLPSEMGAVKAVVLLGAIAIQESGLRTRQQVGGPAHGLWQFEIETVQGLMANEATAKYVKALCVKRGVPFQARAIFNYLLVDDILAAALARLDLWANPTPLPDAHDVDDAWLYYCCTWRPGQPDPSRWDASHASAVEAMGISA